MNSQYVLSYTVFQENVDAVRHRIHQYGTVFKDSSLPVPDLDYRLNEFILLPTVHYAKAALGNWPQIFDGIKF